MDVVEAAHEHLAIAPRRFQLSVDDVPVALAVAPLVAEATSEVIGHRVWVLHAALDVVLHDEGPAIDLRERQTVMAARQVEVLECQNLEV